MRLSRSRLGDPFPASAREILDRFGPKAHPALQGYLRTHARRYAWIVDYLQPLIEDRRRDRSGAGLKVLDVGPSFQTFLLADLVPDGRVDTIGYYDPKFLDAPDGTAPARLRLPADQHVSFDLNDTEREELWPRLADYDLVLMAETIEHLYVGPTAVLRFLASGLRPGGYLVVQTPNAVALHKRVWMAIGRSPINPLPDNRPGEAHLHEYTIDELVAGGRRAGLDVTDISLCNCVGGTLAARWYGALGRLLPRSLRDGLAVTFRVPVTPARRT